MGFGAIIFAILNLVWTSKQKNSKWFGFISLSLTALTACSFYSDAAVQVTAEDWGALMDILPSMSKTLWICVILSILVNSITLLGDKKWFNFSLSSQWWKAGASVKMSPPLLYLILLFGLLFCFPLPLLSDRSYGGLNLKDCKIAHRCLKTRNRGYFSKATFAYPQRAARKAPIFAFSYGAAPREITRRAAEV